MNWNIEQAVRRRLFPKAGLHQQHLPDPGIQALLLDDKRYPGVEAALPDRWDEWPISRETARFLARLVVEEGRSRVLEFGAGLSSLVLAQALSHAGGGRLTSIEQYPDWCAEAWGKVEQTASIEARLLTAEPELRITRQGFYYLYARAAREVAARAPYNLVLVDAPPFFYGRTGALPLILPHLSPGALIILDDAGRLAEQWTLYTWLSTYPSLRLALYDPGFAKKGVAVLRYGGTPTIRFAMAGFASSSLHILRTRRQRRRFSTTPQTPSLLSV